MWKRIIYAFLTYSYLFTKITCFTCNDGCTTCTQDSTPTDFYCDGCKDDYAPLVDKTSNCLPTNSLYPSYWYDDGVDKNFKKCNEACLRCTDATTDACQICNIKLGYYHVNPNSCVFRTKPPEGFFFNTVQPAGFAECYASCSHCDAAGDDSNHHCEVCKTDVKWMLPGTKNCVDPNADPKPEGYYYDNTDGWKKCYSTCKVCTGSGTENDHQCTTCIQNFGLINTSCYNTQAPPDEYYYDTDNSVFAQCHSNCKKCTAAGTDDTQNCSVCKDPKKLFTDTNCYGTDSPPQGFTWNTDSNAFLLDDTTQCYESCATCIGTGDVNNNNCDTCKAEYYPMSTDKKQCRNTKPPGTYLGQNKWNPCDVSCENCSDGTSCLSCKNNYFRLNGEKLCKSSCPNDHYGDTTVKTCKHCVYPCRECTNDSTCVNCFDGYIFDTPSRKCIKQCNQNQYPDKFGNCLDCPPKCASCKNQFTCLTCPPGSLKHNDNCIPQCPPGTFLSKLGTCLSCNSVCSQCVDNTTKCVECRSGYFRSGVNGPCVKICPTGSVLDNQGNCLNCKDKGQVVYGDICVYSCPAGYTPINGVCQTCSAAGLLSMGPLCLYSCPKGYTYAESKSCFRDNYKKPTSVIQTEYTPISECLLQPCHNDGYCRSQTWNNVLSYYCECAVGYYGRRCEYSYQKNPSKVDYNPIDFKLADINWIKGAPSVITRDFYAVLNTYISKQID
jgi:proprotein convertase subtilisin/kexin type 5